MYDLIGDIHGHREALERLLGRLGYALDSEGTYRHPTRRAFFVGDFIDRGPDNPGALQIARAMVKGGAARAVMGNHEYNALLFNTPRADGQGYLRPHSNKNTGQHQATLEQFAGRMDAYADYIDWFRSLPPLYEDDHLRVVHACWHGPSVRVLRETLSNNLLPHPLPQELAELNTPLARALDAVLKGPEFTLPEGASFTDKDGHQRYAMRYKWWENPTGATLGQLSMLPPGEELENLLYTGNPHDHYPTTEKPVFFGHYWLKGTPLLFRHNVCCLDYSVAKGGRLVAYRHDGEQRLDASKLVAV